MAVSRVSFGFVIVVALVLAITLPPSPAHAQTQTQASAPAPSPTSDGTSIDQGIAYVLMAVALLLTYLIHTADFCYSL